MNAAGRGSNGDARWERSPLFDPVEARGADHERALAAVAGVMEDPDGFRRRERAAVAEAEVHRLSGSRRPVVIRHATKDLGVIDEVFVRRLYEPPAPVLERLSALDRAPRVVDIGANVGLTAVYFLELLPAAELLCVEPDHANAAILERCLALNLEHDRWKVIAACAGARDGEVTFAEGRHSASQIVAAGTSGADTVPVVDVLPALAGADLVKLDAEGAEWELLEDPRFARLSDAALVLEYHAHLCPGDHPRRQVEDRLSGLGYELRHLFERPGGEVGMLWAWRP